jgi:hypothetical protein
MSLLPSTNPCSSTPRPLVDLKNRIIAVLAGRPTDPGYVAAATESFHAIDDAGEAAVFCTDEKRHRRGHFPALAIGISYGKGQAQPANLDNGVHAAMLQRLIGNASIQRLAMFASGKA